MPTVLGLDLAQRKDYSALVGMEQFENPDRGNRYVIQGLERLPQRMPYPEQIRYVAEKISRLPNPGDTLLAIDQTGVGLPVVDAFREAGLPVSIVPILITGGHKCSQEPGGCWHVPKIQLCSVLMVLIESNRLRLVPGLPFADTLKAELQTFTARITTAGNEVMGAWREGAHDDLVLAVALACWVGENCCTRFAASHGQNEFAGAFGPLPKNPFALTRASIRDPYAPSEDDDQ